MFFENWCMNNPFVGPSAMTFCPTKVRILRNVITQNVIWADQKYGCLCAHNMLDLICFLAFVGASNIILSILSICQWCTQATCVATRLCFRDWRSWPTPVTWTRQAGTAGSPTMWPVPASRMRRRSQSSTGGTPIHSSLSTCEKLVYGQFHNCQSWSFIIAHGQF